MPDGPTITLRLLSETTNEAATAVLIAALDSSSHALSIGAVRALLQRRNFEGMRELVRRADAMPETWRHAVHDLHGRITPVVRELLEMDDAANFERGCRAAIAFREYELIPILIGMLEDDGHPFAQEAAAALIALADELYHDLATTRDERRRRDPQTARNHAVAALEQSIRRFAAHQRREPIEAFLQLVPRDNALLSRILSDPREPSFVPMLEILQSSVQPGVMRLLSGFLDDSRPPTAGLSAGLRRTDRRWVDHLLKRIGAEPSPAIRANLKHVGSIPWLADQRLVESLDEPQQRAAVRMAAVSGIKREALTSFLEFILRVGKPEGRRAAAISLSELKGPEIDVLLLRALRDDDPQVHAAGLRQVRPRGIPGALTTLIQALDHPAAEVREAARANLEEFTFRRYLPAFELLDDSVRRTTGILVRKVDPTAPRRLHEEMLSAHGKRRMRALEIAACMELVVELQPDIVQAAADGDHLVRVEAARALGQARGAEARRALERLRDDVSFTVRETAEQSLERLNQAAQVAGDLADNSRIGSPGSPATADDARPLDRRKFEGPAWDGTQLDDAEARP
jgi:HEAT repeat protein